MADNDSDIKHAPVKLWQV